MGRIFSVLGGGAGGAGGGVVWSAYIERDIVQTTRVDSVSIALGVLPIDCYGLIV